MHTPSKSSTPPSPPTPPPTHRVGRFDALLRRAPDLHRVVLAPPAAARQASGSSTHDPGGQATSSGTRNCIHDTQSLCLCHKAVAITAAAFAAAVAGTATSRLGSGPGTLKHDSPTRSLHGAGSMGRGGCASPPVGHHRGCGAPASHHERRPRTPHAPCRPTASRPRRLDP